MKILAWDTSSKSGSIALLEDEHLLFEHCLNLEATQSEQLLSGVDQLLEMQKWDLKEVDLFCVGLGPGSYTGLRIGITTARTLSEIFNKPVMGISSLLALSWTACNQLKKENKNQSKILVLQPITPKESFAFVETVENIFNKNTDELKKSEMILSFEQIKNVRQNVDRSIESDLIKAQECHLGEIVGRLGYRDFKNGQIKPISAIRPRYLRGSYAEIKFGKTISPLE